jgi:hypothetical protein
MSSSDLIRAKAHHLADIATRGGVRIDALAKLAAELLAEADALDGVRHKRAGQPRERSTLSVSYRLAVH